MVLLEWEDGEPGGSPISRGGLPCIVGGTLAFPPDEPLVVDIFFGVWLLLLLRFGEFVDNWAVPCIDAAWEYERGFVIGCGIWSLFAAR